MDILEKPSYISNEEMLNRCLLLKKVLDAKTEKQIGRGKTTQTIQANKYDTNTLHYKRIANSCEHYQKKVDMETSSGITFRDYQLDIIEQGTAILQANGFLYLAMEVRTGKTLTSLGIARNIDAKNVLFITKKKAISSIQSDYNMLSCPFDIQIINYESLHLVADNAQWDLIICDEAHSCFIGSTTVDGINIKDIKLGDYLNSFNFATNKYELKKVVNIYKNELSENLVKIKCNGKEIVCTESHKIFTKRGWVEARHITSEDELQIL
jgi:hypothetical protein